MRWRWHLGREQVVVRWRAGRDGKRTSQLLLLDNHHILRQTEAPADVGKVLGDVSRQVLSLAVGASEPNPGVVEEDSLVEVLNSGHIVGSAEVRQKASDSTALDFQCADATDVLNDPSNLCCSGFEPNLAQEQTVAGEGWGGVVAVGDLRGLNELAVTDQRRVEDGFRDRRNGVAALWGVRGRWLGLRGRRAGSSGGTHSSGIVGCLDVAWRRRNSTSSKVLSRSWREMLVNLIIAAAAGATIIVSIGLAHVGSIEHGRRVGGMDFLQKSIRLEHVREKVL